jgi:hypothetical protein
MMNDRTSDLRKLKVIPHVINPMPHARAREKTLVNLRLPEESELVFVQSVFLQLLLNFKLL